MTSIPIYKVKKEILMFADVNYRDVLILRLNEFPTDPIMVKAHSKYLKLNYLFIFNGRNSKFCSVNSKGVKLVKRTNERHLHKVFLLLKSMSEFKFFCQTPPLFFWEGFDLSKSGVIKNKEIKQTMNEWIRSHQ